MAPHPGLTSDARSGFKDTYRKNLWQVKECQGATSTLGRLVERAAMREELRVPRLKRCTKLIFREISGLADKPIDELCEIELNLQVNIGAIAQTAVPAHEQVSA